MASNKYSFRKILVTAVWIMLGAGNVVLLVAAITKKNTDPIAGVEIKIMGVRNNYFVDRKDVVKIIEKVNAGKLDKAIASSLNLGTMERALQKDQWIKRAEMFFDNNNVLQVKIIEREPVARIFTSTGSSFYIDSSLKRLPLSDKFSARLPVFTSFPTDVLVLTKADSLLLKSVKVMSEFIGNNPFWMAQIEQVDITPSRTFELIPKLGNQVIRFGGADNYESKFNKLLAFYKQVQTRTGWTRYSIVDVQFKNQVVAVKRDAKGIKMDSLRAIQIMKDIIADAQKKTNDSANIQLVQPEDNNSKINQSPVIDDVPDENTSGNGVSINVDSVSNRVATTTKAAVSDPLPVKAKPSAVNSKPSIINSKATQKKSDAFAKKLVNKKQQAKPPVKKAEIQEEQQQPKAVMPPKSDY